MQKEEKQVYTQKNRAPPPPLAPGLNPALDTIPRVRLTIVRHFGNRGDLRKGYGLTQYITRPTRHHNIVLTTFLEEGHSRHKN